MDLKRSSACSGCGVCVSECPKKAIKMSKDSLGFLYPKIDDTLCINCNICRKMCPFNEEYVAKNKTDTAFALKHNEEVRKSSSSGGFFTAFSDYILKHGGVVYGAVWTDDFKVVHIKAENKDDRNRMRGSKYIQSDLSSIYAELKKNVKDGRLVLFTGTPCQCAAVSKLFEKKNPDNLWMIDIICHGVLSPDFFNEYLAEVKHQNNGKNPVAVNLRDKRFGWQSVGITFDDGSVYNSESDYFYKAYATHAFQRPSCFSCTCTKEYRFGDFTVGDFWGMQKSHPEFYDELGVSLVLVNSSRGLKLLKNLTQGVDIIEIKEEDYLPYQPNLRRPIEKGSRADFISNYYKKHGYKKTMHRLFDVTLVRRFNKFGHRVLSKLLKKR